MDFVDCCWMVWRQGRTISFPPFIYHLSIYLNCMYLPILPVFMFTCWWKFFLIHLTVDNGGYVWRRSVPTVALPSCSGVWKGKRKKERLTTKTELRLAFNVNYDVLYWRGWKELAISIKSPQFSKVNVLVCLWWKSFLFWEHIYWINNDIMIFSG